jgi:hypothetical protein
MTGLCRTRSEWSEWRRRPKVTPVGEILPDDFEDEETAIEDGPRSPGPFTVIDGGKK